MYKADALCDRHCKCRMPPRASAGWPQLPLQINGRTLKHVSMGDMFHGGFQILCHFSKPDVLALNAIDSDQVGKAWGIKSSFIATDFA